jgi:hypothetical protein
MRIIVVDKIISYRKQMMMIIIIVMNTSSHMINSSKIKMIIRMKRIIARVMVVIMY